MKTEFDLMVNGKLYNSFNSDLEELRVKARDLVLKYNNSSPYEVELRKILLKEIFSNEKNVDTAFFEPSIRVEYGFNMRFGKNFYMNFDCVLMDVCPITIGDNVMFGPRVVVATPMHPLLAEERIAQQYPDGFYNIEYAKPITIGNNVWVAANVTICGGVHIGDNSVIAAGSVVTKDIPSNVIAGGVPCKVIRELNETDRMNVWETYIKEKQK